MATKIKYMEMPDWLKEANAKAGITPGLSSTSAQWLQPEKPINPRPSIVETGNPHWQQFYGPQSSYAARTTPTTPTTKPVALAPAKVERPDAFSSATILPKEYQAKFDAEKRPTNDPNKSWWSNFLDTASYDWRHWKGIAPNFGETGVSGLVVDSIKHGMGELVNSVENLARVAYKGSMSVQGNYNKGRAEELARFGKTYTPKNAASLDAQGNWDETKDPVYKWLDNSVQTQKKNLDQLDAYIRQEHPGFASQATYGALNFLPTVLATMYTGGVLGEAAGTTELLANMGKGAKIAQGIIKMLPFAATQFGSSELEGEKMGGSYTQALQYGALNAVGQSALMYVGGEKAKTLGKAAAGAFIKTAPEWLQGILNKGGSEVIDAGVRKIAGTWGQVGYSFLKNVAHSGAMMAGFGTVQRAAKSATIDSTTKVLDPEALKQEFASGGLIAAFTFAMGLPGEYQSKKMANAMLDAAKQAESNPESADVAGGVNPTEHQKDELIRQVIKDAETAEKAGQFQQVADENYKHNNRQVVEVLNSLKEDGINIDEVAQKVDPKLDQRKAILAAIDSNFGITKESSIWDNVKADTGYDANPEATQAKKTIWERLGGKLTDTQELSSKYGINVEQTENLRGNPTWEVKAGSDQVKNILSSKEVGGRYLKDRDSYIFYNDPSAKINAAVKRLDEAGLYTPPKTLPEADSEVQKTVPGKSAGEGPQGQAEPIGAKTGENNAKVEPQEEPKFTARQVIEIENNRKALNDNYGIRINETTNTKGRATWIVAGEATKFDETMRNLGGKFIAATRSYAFDHEPSAEIRSEVDKQANQPTPQPANQAVEETADTTIQQAEKPQVAERAKPAIRPEEKQTNQNVEKQGNEETNLKRNRFRGRGPGGVNKDPVVLNFKNPAEIDLSDYAGRVKRSNAGTLDFDQQANADRLKAWLKLPKDTNILVLSREYNDWINEQTRNLEKGPEEDKINFTVPAFEEFLSQSDEFNRVKGEIQPAAAKEEPKPAEKPPLEPKRTPVKPAARGNEAADIRVRLLKAISDQAKSKALEEMGFKNVEELQAANKVSDYENLVRKYTQQFGGKVEPTPEPSIMENNAETEAAKKDLGSIKNIPVKDIKVDPERFQFKANVDAETGAGNLLKGVNNYDPFKAGLVTLWQDKDGQYWVVNGHHRMELASRAGVESVNAQILREKDGITDKDARQFGAILNLAEGRGTPLDAAKIFRENNTTVEDLAKEGISLTEGVVNKGFDLSRLNDRLFPKVINGDLSIEKGAIIGREFGNSEEGQNAIMDLLQGLEKNGKTVTNERLKGLIEEVKNGETVAEVQQTLFGEITNLKSNITNKLDVLEGVTRILKSKKNLFTNLTNNDKSQLAQMAGNILAKDVNIAERQLSERAIEVVSTLAHKKGNFVSDTLNKYANAMLDGMPKSEAVRNAFADIEKNIKGGNLLENYWTNNQGSAEINQPGTIVQGTVEERARQIEALTKGTDPDAPEHTPGQFHMEMADELTHIENLRALIDNSEDPIVKEALENHIKLLEKQREGKDVPELTDEEMAQTQHKHLNNIEGAFNFSPTIDFESEAIRNAQVGEELNRYIHNNTLNAAVTPEEVKTLLNDNPQLTTHDRLSNDEVINKANDILLNDFNGAIRRIRSAPALNGALDGALAIGIYKRFVMDGDVNRAAAWQIEVAEKTVESGRSIQILSTLKKYTPDWTLKQATREINRTLSEKTKENVSNHAEDIADAVNKINKEGAGELADKFEGQSVQDLINTAKKAAGNEGPEQPGAAAAAETTAPGREGARTPLEPTRPGQAGEQQRIPGTGPETEGVPGPTKGAERLADKVSNTLKEKVQTFDPLKDMINTLFDVARKTLPDNKVMTRDPIVFLKLAMENQAEYKETWDIAKRLVEERHTGNPEALQALEQYFGTFLDRPFSDELLNRAINKEIKNQGINLQRLIKENDFNVSDSVEKFANKLTAEGMTPDNAMALSQHINNRFTEMIKESRQRSLDAKMRPFEVHTVKNRKTPAQVLSELSNLQAFILENQDRTEPLLQRTVRAGVKEMQRYEGLNMSKIIRDHFTKIDAAGRSLLQRLTDEGIRAEDAHYLATYITKEFGNIVNERKTAELDRLSAEKKIKPKEKKLYYQKIIELSNLGLFDKNRYRTYAAKILGVRALSDEAALEIRNRANDIQTMPMETPEQIRARDVKIAEMLDRIAQEIPPTILQRVNTLQTMAQLLNLKTMRRNVVSNAFFVTADSIMQTLSIPADKLAEKGIPWLNIAGTGKRSVGLPMPSEFFKGFKEGLRIGWEDGKKGINTHRGIGTMNDLPKTTFRLKPEATGIGKAINRAAVYSERGMNIGLSAVDYAFKKGIMQESIATQMKIAEMNGEAIPVPTEEMVNRATALANYRTFNDMTTLAKAFTRLKRGLNVGKAWGLGDLLIKYPKTPANLIMRGIDYSPLGFARTAYELAAPYLWETARKDFDQNSFAMSAGRAIGGSISLVAAGAILHRIGVMSGRPSTDSDERAMQEMSGLGAYKLNLSALARWVQSGGTLSEKLNAKMGNEFNDLIVNYDWFQPFSFGATLGAAWDENKGAGKQMGNLSAAFSSAMDTVENQSLMTGIKTFMQAGSLGKGLVALVKTVPSSFTPTILSQIKQFTDNTKYESYNHSATIQALNLAINKIPWLAETLLEKKINPFGQDAQIYQDNTNNFYNVFLAAMTTTHYRPQAAAELPLKIEEQTGEKKQLPRTANATITYLSKRYELNQKQYHDYAQYLGNRTLEEYQKLADAGYPPDTDTAKMMYNVLQNVNDEAKFWILSQMQVPEEDLQKKSTSTKAWAPYRSSSSRSSSKYKDPFSN